jgi:hypothetical protein
MSPVLYPGDPAAKGKNKSGKIPDEVGKRGHGRGDAALPKGFAVLKG